MNRLVRRDERESNVDLEAARAAWIVLAFGLLLVVMYRSFAQHEAPWDLLGLVVLSGVVSTGWTAYRRAASRAWLLAGVAAIAVGAVVAAVLAVLR
jgi:hypothetical protein